MFNFLTKNVENFGAVTYAQYPTFSKETKKIFFIKPHLGQVCVAGSGKK